VDVNLDHAECLALLESCDVGRLGVVDGGQPLIFPVNYQLDGDTIVFRTDPGTKLDTAPLERVAFEVDGLDPGRREGWSVLVQGVGQEITTAIDRTSERLRGLPVEPWAGGPRAHWVRVVPRVISGRRVSDDRIR
jgi:nitroimidazol reductase NimA-like FMN-containing flavoprotein (pyridoxamine 5'-phosphate oxidase superfamily)